MRIIFTIGLGIEVAGAALLAWEAMTTVRGTFPSSGGPEEQRPRSHALVGFGLLAVGVAVQVVGYAVDELWLLALTAGVIVAAILVGRWLADGPVWRRLTRRM